MIWIMLLDSWSWPTRTSIRALALIDQLNATPAPPPPAVCSPNPGPPNQRYPRSHSTLHLRHVKLSSPCSSLTGCRAASALFPLASPREPRRRMLTGGEAPDSWASECPAFWATSQPPAPNLSNLCAAPIEHRVDAVFLRSVLEEEGSVLGAKNEK